MNKLMGQQRFKPICSYRIQNRSRNRWRFDFHAKMTRGHISICEIIISVDHNREITKLTSINCPQTRILFLKNDGRTPGNVLESFVINDAEMLGVDLTPFHVWAHRIVIDLCLHHERNKNQNESKNGLKHRFWTEFEQKSLHSVPV